MEMRRKIILSATAATIAMLTTAASVKRHFEQDDIDRLVATCTAGSAFGQKFGTPYTGWQRRPSARFEQRVDTGRFPPFSSLTLSFRVDDPQELMSVHAVSFDFSAADAKSFFEKVGGERTCQQTLRVRGTGARYR